MTFNYPPPSPTCYVVFIPVNTRHFLTSFTAGFTIGTKTFEVRYVEMMKNGDQLTSKVDINIKYYYYHYFTNKRCLPGFSTSWKYVN